MFFVVVESKEFGLRRLPLGRRRGGGRLGRVARNGAAVREEENLNGQRQAEVQGDDDYEEDLARLVVGGTEDRVKVAQQEGDGHTAADRDEDPVKNVDGGPADEGYGDPDQVCVAVQSPTL